MKALEKKRDYPVAFKKEANPRRYSGEKEAQVQGAPITRKIGKKVS